MEVPASRSRRMVPGPESNNTRDLPICIRTEHELRFSDGTHVPDPSIVTVMPGLFPAMFYQNIMLEITAFVNFTG
jgi:hypothetical protein